MRTALIAMAAAMTITAVGPAPAMAQTQGDRADARCILVLGVVGRDPKQREGALQGVYYFLGRLQAHGAQAKLETMMREEGQAITSKEQVQAELNRCSGVLRQSASALETTYKNLQAAAEAARPGAKPPSK